MSERAQESLENIPTPQESQLLKAITSHALKTEVGSFLQEVFPTQPTRIAIEAVRSYVVHPLHEASQIIDALPQEAIDTDANYQSLVLQNNPVFDAFLDFVGDFTPPTASLPVQRVAFNRLNLMPLDEIGAEMGRFLADQFLTNTSANLAETERKLEGIFDFVLPKNALPYAHAAMSIERQARETEHYTLGRALENVYIDPLKPEHEQPHFTYANQDALLILQLPTYHGEEVLLMVGADGITLDGIDMHDTGHSQEVSHQAVLLLAKKLRQMTEVTPKKLADAFEQVNREIYREFAAKANEFRTEEYIDDANRTQHAPMLPGSTLFATVLYPDKAVWAAVGDSYIACSNERPMRRMNSADAIKGTSMVTMFIGQNPDVFFVPIDNADSQPVNPGEPLIIHSDGIHASVVDMILEEAKAFHPEATPQHLAWTAIEAQKDTNTKPKQTVTADNTYGIIIPTYQLKDDALIAIAKKK